MKSSLYALAIFSGTIIGVGFFGIPYVALKSGFFVVLFYFIFLGAIAIFIHLLLSEVISKTDGIHRFPGYAKIYLGNKGKAVASFGFIISLYGALIAYLIVGGDFLASLFSPLFGGETITYNLIFFILGSLFIYFGIKAIKQIEVGMLTLFFVILVLFYFKGFPLIDIKNFLTLNVKNLFFPYGVILFSLWGTPIIPEVKEMLNQKRKLKKIIIIGILISTLTYLAFTYLALGICGEKTTEVAIFGLENFLGKIIYVGFIFGFLTSATSFLTLGLTLKKVFWYDFKIKKNLSFVLASFIPLLIFLLGARNFINIIGLVGGIACGIEGILIILIYRKFKENNSEKSKYFFSFSRLISYFLILLFTLGIVYEIFYFLKK